jgi:AcrR family transcriptional regulator
MKNNEEKGPDTRERLLEAAGEVFALRGYRAATVREISQRANANVAAVNYHFRDKEGLYIAVLEQTLKSAVKRYPPDLGLTEAATPEEQLHAFVRSLLLRLLDEGRPAWHGKLMAREITEPTTALDLVTEGVIRPLHLRLASIVRHLLGPDCSEQSVRLCVLSIIGQCLFYHHSRQVILRLYPLRFDPEEIEQMAEHISRFSLLAMRELSKEK